MNTRQRLFVSLAASAFAVAASAQSVVVPVGMDTSSPGSSAYTWQNSLFHFQMLYDASHFLSQGIDYPIAITRLRYRAAGSATSAGGETYSGVTVKMTSSPNDWSNASTTFAFNLGGDVATVFFGSIACVAAAGTSPNNYIIDIPLTTPFNYDPTSRLDLCIDVNAPNAPMPTGVPSMATSNSPTHMAKRIASTTANATTGSASDWACVVLMDYTPVPNAATAVTYGKGCVGKALTCYEEFAAGTFDLQGTAGAPNSIRMTPMGSGYVVAPGSSGWFTPNSTALVLADDQLSSPMPLTFIFGYPGGSTSSILVCSNGYVWLDTTQTSTAAVGRPDPLLAQGARLAPLWHDMDPSAGGAVYFDVDPSGNAAYVTWDHVPLFNVGGTQNTLQLAMYSDGRAEYRYQVCQNGDGLVGWSPGNDARDPAGIDISASMPFQLEPDVYPLTLLPRNRPKLGSTFTVEASNFTPASTVVAFAIGRLQYAPGIPLDVIGMRSCFEHASIDGLAVYPVAGTARAFSVTIPASPALVGAHAYSQAIATAPGSTSLGVISSNGIDSRFDVN